ncbi:hypothetical protein F5878DRAFT_306911 [Lentinula raphanica]|uniref:Uncharacterized protein n=1 Tax=Lentinula raphanica TaxID=153919 RepID=A0AA38P3H7_9AGAR|nr:hypothetical protein F5878DRAFT_306911 [Lentinula raphanica]
MQREYCWLVLSSILSLLLIIEYSTDSEYHGPFATAHQFTVLSALLAFSSIASRLSAYVNRMALLKALCGSINSPWRILSIHVDRPLRGGRATPSTSSWFRISARVRRMMYAGDLSKLDVRGFRCWSGLIF